MNETVNENSWIPLMVVACATFIIFLQEHPELLGRG